MKVLLFLFPLLALGLVGVAVVGIGGRRPERRAARVEDGEGEAVTAPAGGGRRSGAGDSSVRARLERTSPGVAPSPRADEPRSDEPAAADGARPQPRSEAEFAAAMGEAFARDRPGNAGSASTLAAVSAAFHGPRTAGALLRAADCRATRCRLTVEFDDAAANNRVVAEMFTALAENGADVTDLGIAVPTRDVHADGRIDATVYLFHGEPTLR